MTGTADTDLDMEVEALDAERIEELRDRARDSLLKSTSKTRTPSDRLYLDVLNLIETLEQRDGELGKVNAALRTTVEVAEKRLGELEDDLAKSRAVTQNVAEDLERAKERLRAQSIKPVCHASGKGGHRLRPVGKPYRKAGVDGIAFVVLFCERCGQTLEIQTRHPFAV